MHPRVSLLSPWTCIIHAYHLPIGLNVAGSWAGTKWEWTSWSRWVKIQWHEDWNLRRCHPQSRHEPESDSRDANLHFNFSWPCSSHPKPPYIPLRPVHPCIVKEVLQDVAYACRIMLHRHKVAQLKRVAGATKNYVNRCLKLYICFSLTLAWLGSMTGCVANFHQPWEWIRHLQRSGSPALPQPLAQESKAAWMGLEVSSFTSTASVSTNTQASNFQWSIKRNWNIIGVQVRNMTEAWPWDEGISKGATLACPSDIHEYTVVDAVGQVIPMIQLVDVQRWVRQYSRKQLGTPNVVNRAVAETARTATWPKTPTLAMKKTSWILLDTLPLKESPLKKWFHHVSSTPRKKQLERTGMHHRPEKL